MFYFVENLVELLNFNTCDRPHWSQPPVCSSYSLFTIDLLSIIFPLTFRSSLFLFCIRLHLSAFVCICLHLFLMSVFSLVLPVCPAGVCVGKLLRAGPGEWGSG